jgi:hypothetical protein
VKTKDHVAVPATPATTEPAPAPQHTVATVQTVSKSEPAHADSSFQSAAAHTHSTAMEASLAPASGVVDTAFSNAECADKPLAIPSPAADRDTARQFAVAPTQEESSETGQTTVEGTDGELAGVSASFLSEPNQATTHASEAVAAQAALALFSSERTDSAMAMTQEPSQTALHPAPQLLVGLPAAAEAAPSLSMRTFGTVDALLGDSFGSATDMLPTILPAFAPPALVPLPPPLPLLASAVQPTTRTAAAPVVIAEDLRCLVHTALFAPVRAGQREPTAEDMLAEFALRPAPPRPDPSVTSLAPSLAASGQSLTSPKRGAAATERSIVGPTQEGMVPVLRPTPRRSQCASAAATPQPPARAVTLTVAESLPAFETVACALLREEVSRVSPASKAVFADATRALSPNSLANTLLGLSFDSPCAPARCVRECFILRG